MPRKTTVLFDLDGTLIDSIRLILESFHHTFAVFGLPPRPDAELLRGIGTPLRNQFAKYSRDPADVETLVDTYRAHNLAHHDAQVKAFPGAVACVKALSLAGVRLGIVTSKNRHTTEKGLLVSGLVEFFPVIITSDDVERPKPHREPVDLALSKLGALAEEAIFVGDSLHDMHAGKSAAVATGAALWGPFTRDDLASSAPDHWLDSFEDLLSLVLG